MLVLESLEHAEKHGATILAEVVGYGNTRDAYHDYSTSEGQGAIKAIKLALEEAGISQSKWLMSMPTELQLLLMKKEKVGLSVAVLGREVPYLQQILYRTLAWGCRAVEAALPSKLCAITLYQKQPEQVVSDYIEANVVYGQGLEQEIPYAISNTFGFGGHNAVLAFKRWEA